MNAATKLALFDPFYSTKPVSEGTGLGLPTSLAIVKSHGGFLRVYSEIGQGSTFKVYLPASQDAMPVAEEAAAQPIAGSGEYILVVDDELPVREACRRALEHRGYRVVTAAGGVEAIDVIEQRGPEFTAVISDVHMPGMDGTSLMSTVGALQPGLPIIAMSGLADGHLSQEFAAFGARFFLAKPFTTAALLEAVRSAIVDHNR